MKTYFAPLLHRSSRLDLRSSLRLVREKILSQEVVVVGQNIKYDLARLAHASGGPMVLRCLADDSMVYHYMLSEHSTTRSLDYLSRRFSKHGGYKELVKGQMSAIQDMDVDTLAQYNGTDAQLPIEIIEGITRELKENGYYSQELINFYRRIVPFVATIESAGMAVDVPRLEELIGEHEVRIAKLQEEAAELAGEVNLDSPKQLREFFFEQEGCEIPDVPNPLTEKGEISTRMEVLEALDHPLAQKIVEFRQLSKKLRTYFRGTEKELTRRGLVYPEYFITKTAHGGGTTSGRLSAKKPPVQTFNHEDREIFISRHQGGILLEFDGSQMELRYAAMVSGDDFLCDVFQRGLDPHQATADLCGVERSIAKNVNFGAIYGISKFGLMEKMRLSERLATKIYKTTRKEWEKLFQWLDWVGQEACLKGEVTTPYGRWRRVPGANVSTPQGRFLMREAVNFLIQAPASDLVQLLGWRAMLDLDGLALPIVSIHDGIVFDVQPGQLDKAVDLLYSSIQQWKIDAKEVLGIELTLPFEFTVKAGKNWRDMEEVTTIRTEDA